MTKEIYMCAFCDRVLNSSDGCVQCNRIDGAITFDEWIGSAS